MSLIPFILELADELHEFNRCLATGGMDIDDFGFGIYPHELQPQQQQQQQSQHPLQQQQQQQQHLSQQRRPRSLSQFYWMPNISKSRHHPYYRGKPCCNKTPIHLVHDHHLEKELASTAGGGSGGGVIGTSPTSGAGAAGDKESAANTHATNSGSSNTSPNTTAGKSAYSVVNKNGFQVSMNVKQFAPNELTVKTIDNCIVVEGQHEDKEDGHGVISRHFIRKYMLPKGYDPNEVLSTLSSDGILTVKAPPPAMKTDESMERIVDIQQTSGPVQAQQSPVKEPSNNTQGIVKEVQANAASAVEQTVTLAAVAAAVTAAAAVTTAPLQTSTLQQPQKQQKQQTQESQQLCAAVETVQQQQQQSSKVAQPITAKDLQVTRERNGNLEPSELVIEQETEPRTAEQAATSSNVTNNNNNNNNNNNTNREGTNIDCGIDYTDMTVTTNTNSKTEVKEKECSAEKEEQTGGMDNVNNKKPVASNETKSLAIDAIMTAATAEEPMETEENEQIVAKKEVTENKPIVVEVHMADHDVDTSNSSNINSVANSSTTSDNCKASSNIVVPRSDTPSAVEINGVEIIPTNNIDIELTTSTTAEPSEILVVTKNGVSDDKTVTVTDDGLTITLETTVGEADGVTEMETDGDAMDGGVIAIGVDIGVGVDVNVIAGDGGSANVEDGNEENGSVGNLVVAAQSPTAADLVAAADAAILLAKTQCDGGAADVAAGKPAITTEEITN